VSRARNGDHDGALADLEWTVRVRGDDIQLDPSFGASYGHRGVRRAKAGEHADAISDLTRGIALTPADTSFREERGKCYFALGDYDRAAADFEILRRMNPAAPLDGSFFIAFVHRAKARLAKGDFVGAVADFDVAVAVDAQHRQDPSYAAAYLARCQHLLGEQKWEAALADFERAAGAKADVEVPATLHVAYCARAQSRHSRGRTEHAMGDLARAIKLAPQEAEPYALRGRLHMDRMDFADALKDLEQAVALDAARQEALGPLIQEARQAIR
jgi:tetratricopeptide (TPR) repeat protein